MAKIMGLLPNPISNARSLVNTMCFVSKNERGLTWLSTVREKETDASAGKTKDEFIWFRGSRDKYRIHFPIGDAAPFFGNFRWKS